MTCYYPIKAYRSPVKNPESGKPIMVFNPKHALDSTRPIDLPCNRCTGCRIDKARDWAVRCKHESQMHKANAFITLTYNDEHLPETYSADKRPFQLFMKKLRKALEPKTVRFFGCGEYGDQNGRPHFHALIFGHQFADLKYHSKNDQGDISHTSEELSDIWTEGLATTGEVTFKSAGYCARYVLKKITGDDERVDNHYWRLNPLNQKYHRVATEWATQSLKPGLGSTWFEKYKSDVFPADFVVIDGNKLPVPDFYLQKLPEEERDAIKLTRTIKSRDKSEKTDWRLYVREEVKKSKLKTLSRKL